MWHKLWLETRWRFLLALVLVTCLSAVDVAQADRVMPKLGLALGDFPQFVWKMYFTRVSLAWLLGTLLLASGGLLREQAVGTSLFSLSLPISRRRWLLTRVLAAVIESFVLAFVPVVVIPVVARAVGHSYPAEEAIKFSLLMFLTGLAAFGVGVLGSTLVQGEYAPILLGVGFVFLIGMLANISLPAGEFGDYITGRQHMDSQWHLTKGWPWWAIAANLAGAIGLIALAVRRLERRDF
jgi:ABC-type transport system involved in multi-copper enzyme maturation permease subunit